MRAPTLLVLVSAGAGVGIGLALRPGGGNGGVGITPQSEPVPAYPPQVGAVLDLREPVVPPPTALKIPEAPSVVLATPTATAQASAEPPTSSEVLEALGADELKGLEQRLTQELDELTRDEFQARLTNGLGELVGTDPTLTGVETLWDREVVMALTAKPDGTWWKVVLPRDEFPDAYALFDRRRAVRAALGRD